jgi:iron(III) transport system ATP-binding protein
VPARGVVQRARFMGHESLVEFVHGFRRQHPEGHGPGRLPAKPGTPLWLTVRRDRCFVFPHRD